MVIAVARYPGLRRRAVSYPSAVRAGAAEPDIRFMARAGREHTGGVRAPESKKRTFDARAPNGMFRPKTESDSDAPTSLGFSGRIFDQRGGPSSRASERTNALIERAPACRAHCRSQADKFADREWSMPLK